MVYHQRKNSAGNFNYNTSVYAQRDWKPHFHRDPELVYVLSGRLKTVVGGREAVLEAGDCALVLSGQIHSFERLGAAQYWIVVFSEEYVPEFAEQTRGKQGKSVGFRLRQSVDLLVRSCLMEGSASQLMKRACLCALCDDYLAGTELEARTEKTDFLAGSVLDYIAAHYTQDVTLRSCAEQLGYEYHYLSRVLEQDYRIGFRRILTQYRLEAALRLLRESTMPVTRIAFESGFQSVRSFNDAVLRHTGKTPRELRA